MLNFAFLSFVSKLRWLRAGKVTAPSPELAAAHPVTIQKPMISCVEPLESRICPSVSVAVAPASNGADNLSIRTVDSGQHIIITEDAVHNQTLVQVDGNGDGLFNGASDFSQLYDETFAQIKISARQGQNNAVDYLLSSDLLNADRHFVLKLGAGANSFDFDAQQHVIDDNTTLAFKVKGVDGAQNTVRFAFDEISNSEVNVAVTLGSGAHDVQASFYGPIHNDSLVNADVSLGAGEHTATINLLGDIAFSSVHVLVNGGDDARGHDAVTYNVAGALSQDALLDIGAALHAGDDSAQVILTQTSFAVRDTSRFYVSIDGGAGNDVIHYSGDSSNGVMPIEGLADALIVGGGGNDRITSDFSAVDSLDITGTFRLRAEGGKGNDALDVGLSNTPESNGSYDVVALGNGGDDVLTFFNDDPTDGLLYDAYGFHLVDGGNGFDQAFTTGNFISVRRVEG